MFKFSKAAAPDETHTFEFDREEIIALCAALPFAYRECFPDKATKIGATIPNVYKNATELLQGPYNEAFVRVLKKFVPFGTRIDELLP